MTGPTIRPMTPPDWPQVAHIYAAGIATFETEPLSWQAVRLIVEARGCRRS
jgi:hypothetical protein